MLSARGRYYFVSGTAIARSLLAANTALTAVVPALRIFAGGLPQGIVLPAISVTKVTGNQLNTVAMTGSHLATEHVQVTVSAKTYASQKQCLALALAALPNTHAVVATFNCESVVPGSEGPDFYDPVAIIYQGSHDFVVKFHR